MKKKTENLINDSLELIDKMMIVQRDISVLLIILETKINEAKTLETGKNYNVVICPNCDSRRIEKHTYYCGTNDPCYVCFWCKDCSKEFKIWKALDIDNRGGYSDKDVERINPAKYYLIRLGDIDLDQYDLK